MRVALLVVLLASFARADDAPPPAPAAPRLEATERTFDAGKVNHGFPVKHTFVLKNVGGAELKIDAKPGWGCTVAEFDSAIPPGGVGKVTASIDTTHYKGTITKSVRVTTNDPAEQVFSLMLSADVVRAIDVLPTDSLALVGRPEQIRPAELTLAAVDGKPFDVLSVEADPRLAVAIAPAPGATSRRHQKAKRPAGTAAPLAAGSSRYILTVKTKPDVQFGHSLALVTVATSHPKEAKIPIRVTLAIQGPLVAQPEALFLRPGVGVQHVAIRRSDDVELTIQGVESTDADFRTTLTTVKAGHEYDLAVEYTGQPGKAVAARITVHTNEPRQRDVVITVSGRV